ncbi:MAG: RsmE family RNA methyltransferase, partial [Rhodospirillaceae bacterium]|nr:RsmE family RNA methyltransferase [Rhodospirillaceae bacterium]
EAECVERIRLQRDAPDLWLLFAPLKKSRTDFVVEKATELGVSTIIPVRTELTNARRVAVRRLRLVAREAAEQCHGLAVPKIRDFTELSGLLASWPDDRTLIVCDEMLRDDASSGPDRIHGAGGGWESIEEISGCSDEAEAKRGLAVLVGPEGGLSQGERRSLRGLPRCVTVSLGSRLLRAETAVAAALTLVNIRGFRR